MSTPTTFEAHGNTWTKHAPGDLMPCDRNEEVSVIWREELDADSMGECFCEAKNWEWSLLPHIPGKNIIGWRRADPPQEKDELTHLREENASMRTAINEAESAMMYLYQRYLTYDTSSDCDTDNIVSKALTNLSPFTESK